MENKTLLQREILPPCSTNVLILCINGNSKITNVPINPNITERYIILPAFSEINADAKITAKIGCKYCIATASERANL